MVFITLEDETGIMNLVIRPDVYLEYQATITEAFGAVAVN
jgi:hypothetical protein